VNLRLIKGLTKKILKNIGYHNVELSILLTDNAEIKYLNKQYLKKDKPTDVLSFPMYEMLLPVSVVGECPPPVPFSGDRFEICPHRGIKGSSVPLRGIKGEDAYCSGILLGDVVISVETAKLQAKKNGVSMNKEITRLLIHGILHLIGYDHEKGHKDALKMRKEEERLLKIATPD